VETLAFKHFFSSFAPTAICTINIILTVLTNLLHLNFFNKFANLQQFLIFNNFITETSKQLPAILKLVLFSFHLLLT
jgi:hypothetical protein